MIWSNGHMDPKPETTHPNQTLTAQCFGPTKIPATAFGPDRQDPLME